MCFSSLRALCASNYYMPMCLRACALNSYMPTCLRTLRAYVLTSFTYLHASKYYVPTRLRALRTCVPLNFMCLRALMP